MKLFILLLCSAVLFSGLPGYGQTSQQVDNELLEKLNSEANHDSNRRKEFRTDKNGKKIFDDEREKGLALFLEQQEKWDLTREKGLAEHRRQKKTASPEEGGPEYIEDQKAKQKQADQLEKARILTLQTRERIRTKLEKQGSTVDETEELGLAQNRPRYDLRKRGRNKWVKNGARPGSGSSGSGGSGGYSAPPPVFDDFAPQPDYAPAPVPAEGFEDIPPPPPMNFDSNGQATPFGSGIDSGFGDVPPPPPPPPPVDYDNF